MKLLLWGAAIAGGYYLLKEAEKKKADPAAAAKPNVDVIVPDGDEGSLYVQGGGMYLDTALPGDVIIELEGLGQCCNNCRQGAPCCG